MKKKLLAMLLLGSAVFTGALGLTACGGDGNQGGGDIDDGDVPLVPTVCEHKNTRHETAHPANCTEDGNTEYWYCNDCKKYFSNEALTAETTLAAVTVSSNGHAYGDWIDEDGASCTEAGVKGHYHCDACGTDFDANKDVLADLVIPAGHAYGDWIDEDGATCTEAGVKGHYHCDACGTDFDANKDVLTDLVIPAAGHAYGTLLQGKDKTCEEDGEIAHYHCGVCGTDFDEDKNVVTDLVIPKGHEYGTLIEYKEAYGCDDGVVAHYHCDACGNDFHEDMQQFMPWESTVIAAPHHIVHYPEKDATCTEEGNDEYWQCTVCEKFFFNGNNTHENTEGPMFYEPLEHKYGGFEYDYATQKYTRVCLNDGTHVEVKDGGTEDYPYLAKDAATLSAALANGGYIKVMNNITAVGSLMVDSAKPSVIDLNKYTVSSNGGALFCVGYNGQNVDITIVNGNISAATNGFAISANKGTSAVTLENVNITQSGYGIYATCGAITVKDCNINAAVAAIQGYSAKYYAAPDSAPVELADYDLSVELSGNTVITGTSLGVNLRSAYFKAEKAKFDTKNTCVILYRDCNATFNGCTFESEIGCAIQGNGTKSTTAVDKNGNTVINYNCGINTVINVDNCTINAVIGIYHPQIDGKLFVTGGTITGVDTAIEVRAGEVEIDGATLISTSEEFGAEANGNGSTTQGIALAVSQHTTNDNIVVTVKNSTLEGIYSLFEKDLMDETTPKDIAISLGEGNTLSGCVYSENCANITESHTAAGEWVYNYTTNVYEKTCADCGEIAETMAAGTEEFPYLVKDAATLSAALANGGYIKLVSNVTVGSVTAGKNTVLDLGGYTITNSATASRLLRIKGAEKITVTVKNGTLKNVADSYVKNNKKTVTRTVMISDVAKEFAPTVTIEGVNLIGVSKQYTDGIYAGDYSDVTVKNCTFDNLVYAATVWTETALTMEDCEIANCFVGVSGQGSSSFGMRSVIAIKNTNISAECGAVYNPQIGGTTTIENGSFESATAAAIEVRGGSVTIDGATVTGNGVFKVDPAVNNGSGGVIFGAAIGVANHSHNDAISVTVTNCTLAGAYALYEENVTDKESKVTLVVGEGNTLSGCVYSENCANITESHTAAGEWVYNYETKAYEKTCSDCGAVITQAAGTEEFPYLISDVEQWAEFAAANNGAKLEKQDGYYKVTSDLDFSEVSDRIVSVYDFSGTIDFDNHTVKGLTESNTYKVPTEAQPIGSANVNAYYVSGLFEVVHDATIKNLNFEGSFLSGRGNGHFTYLVTVALSGNIVIDNVTVSGNSVNAENNAATFVYMVYPYYAMKDNTNYAGISQNISLTLSNCTNRVNVTNSYANTTSKTGYASAFVGTVNNGNKTDGYGKTDLTFENCVNEGTIISYNQASLLIANQTAYNAVASADRGSLTVVNCVNKGKFITGGGYNAVIGASNETVKAFNAKYAENVSNEGVISSISVNTLTAANGKFVLPEVENGVKTTLTFSFFAGKTTENGVKISGAMGRTIDVTGKSDYAVLDFVNAADVEEGSYAKNAEGMYVTNDGNHYVFGIDETVWAAGCRYTSKPGACCTVYDADGNILAIYFYTYAK